MDPELIGECALDRELDNCGFDDIYYKVIFRCTLFAFCCIGLACIARYTFPAIQFIHCIIRQHNRGPEESRELGMSRADLLLRHAVMRIVPPCADPGINFHIVSLSAIHTRSRALVQSMLQSTLSTQCPSHSHALPSSPPRHPPRWRSRRPSRQQQPQHPSRLRQQRRLPHSLPLQRPRAHQHLLPTAARRLSHSGL